MNEGKTLPTLPYVDDLVIDRDPQPTGHKSADEYRQQLKAKKNRKKKIPKGIKRR